MNKQKLVQYFIIGTFVSLYVIVSIISTIHVIEFFELSNPRWLAISLAIAFEIGAAASLASLITLDKMNKVLIWTLFIILTGMQMMGNTYYAYVHLENYQSWIELFGLIEEEPITQKRILAIISGAILPIVALGFIKSLVDYIKPDKKNLDKSEEIGKESNEEDDIEEEMSISDYNQIIKDLLNRELEKKAESVQQPDIEPTPELVEIKETSIEISEPVIESEIPIVEEISIIEETPVVEIEETEDNKPNEMINTLNPQIRPGVN